MNEFSCKNSDAFGDDDNHSYTTEMSQSATSLTSLDTIVEDWEEVEIHQQSAILIVAFFYSRTELVFFFSF